MGQLFIIIKHVWNKLKHILLFCKTTTKPCFSPVNVCLVVLTANSKIYPRSEVQQMEVNIAALYKTMHNNLQWTALYTFKTIDLNMATDSYVCTVVFNLHVRLLSSALSFSLVIIQLTIPNQAFSHHHCRRLDLACHHHPCCASNLKIVRSFLHLSHLPSLSNCWSQL